MSKVKNFDRAQYKSNFDAIRSIIQEGHCAQYDFNVCSKKAAEEALFYLCENNIPHNYCSIGCLGLQLQLMTISWDDEDSEEHAYCFWCEGEI